MSVDASRRRLTLRVADVAVGELWHEVSVDASDSAWFVNDAPDFGDARFLVVELQKGESFVDWAAPLKPAGGGSGERRVGGASSSAARARRRSRPSLPAPCCHSHSVTIRVTPPFTPIDGRETIDPNQSNWPTC